MKKVILLILRIAGVIIVLLVLLGGYLNWKGGSRLSEPYSLDYDDAFIPGDSLSIANGEYLTAIHACATCHGTVLEGDLLMDAPPFRVSATNLTGGAGGIGNSYTDGDWLRAIRHGVKPDGQGIMIMPSDVYYALSDEDVGDMIAYIKTLAPVDNELPTTVIKLMGRMIAGIDENFGSPASLVPEEPRMSMPERGPASEYGKYRSGTYCAACHGADLAGAQPPDPSSPFAPGLLPYAAGSLESFTAAVRLGSTPDGRRLDPVYMPWPSLGQMTDQDVEAIYLYLRTLADH